MPRFLSEALGFSFTGNEAACPGCFALPNLQDQRVYWEYDFACRHGVIETSFLTVRRICYFFVDDASLTTYKREILSPKRSWLSDFLLLPSY
ncbi:hypothetical protein Y032_0352g3268 [Ancylostoma ceylanicum]|uniref:Uncharacterized protein n=1 Tax=Ancylostoma ceylanicum TaxID=53326 RepID=A0A016RWR1_9BILA|nr:hypothetical protein Y032_0352g3268 [Ancylostoma ceylanicum]